MGDMDELDLLDDLLRISNGERVSLVLLILQAKQSNTSLVNLLNHNLADTKMKHKVWGSMPDTTRANSSVLSKVSTNVLKSLYFNAEKNITVKQAMLTHLQTTDDWVGELRRRARKLYPDLNVEEVPVSWLDGLMLPVADAK